MNPKLEVFKKKIQDKEIAVIGIGISNTPLIQFLIQLGAKVSAFDKKTKEQLAEQYDALKKLGVTLFLGENYLSNLNHDIIFKTPGMRCDVPALVAAREKGSVITSEMEVFFEMCPAQIIGVTGSDGKTTTTTLIYNILKEQGYTCWLGGNIGKPLLSEVEQIKAEDKVVLELSSFQLHTMKASPDIAVVTNITPNHLDVHISMQEYIDAKKNIFFYQSQLGKLVINRDNDITRSFEKEAIGDSLFFSRLSDKKEGVFIQDDVIYVNDIQHPVMKTTDIVLPGVHNVENYMAAIGAVHEMVEVESIQKVATTFSGVPHRIELVREINGVRFYNSSIDSSPHRTSATLNTFDQKIILIAGGKDKNIPYDTLGKLLIEKVKCLVLIGPTSVKIEKALQDEFERMGKKIDLPIYHCDSYEEVVKTAYDYAKSSDVVVLSPASTSFDRFKNFEERGNLFKEIVKRL